MMVLRLVVADHCYMNMRAILVAAGVALIATMNVSADEFDDWLKGEREWVGERRFANLAQESEKNQALLRECIAYCAPSPTPTSYTITEPSRCPEESLTVARLGVKGLYCTQHGYKRAISIYFPVKNRFGDVAHEVSSCAWKGHAYELEAECSQSVVKAKQAVERAKR
jgi:hypothetical protein